MEAVEKVARIICRDEVIANAVETAGSLSKAYQANSLKKAYGDQKTEKHLDHIVNRAWVEHVETARKIVSIFDKGRF